MVLITPGVKFLALAAVKFTIPATLFAYSVKAFAKISALTVPTWALVLVSVLFPPFLVVARIVYKRLDDRWQAVKLGARLAPEIQGKAFGNLDVVKEFQWHIENGYPGDFFEDYTGDSSKDPLINLRVVWGNLVFTAWPEHIKLILATDFDNYQKGQGLQHALFGMLGTGIFNSDGEVWKFHRSMTRPFFTRDRFSDFELFDRHTDTVISIIKGRMHTGHAIDFEDLMSRFSLDSASEFLFGHCLHGLKAAIPYPHYVTDIPVEVDSPEARFANEFSRAFIEAQTIITNRERLTWIWPLMEIFVDKIEAPMKVINQYLDPIVRDALEKKRVADATGENKKTDLLEGTLIDHLVNETSDPVLIRDETLNIMLAGRDTTATMISFVMYVLAMYPAVLKRLREEILERVGPTRRPDYDDIKELRYLRAVINETLRLFPIVPFNYRESIRGTLWPSPDPTKKPIYIPGGTKVPYSVFHMHRRTEFWGPDAEEFDPDRFLDDRKSYIVKNPFIFIPFHAGPRICIGQQFAYNEISFMLIRLLQQFSSISLDEKAVPPNARIPAEWANAKGRKSIEKMWPKSHLTMYAHGGVWLKVTEADAS